MAARIRFAPPVGRLAVVLALLLGGVASASAQVPSEYFAQYCAACHTVGGGALVGPDLQDVTTRKDRPWLVQFMLNPQAVVDAGDPYARQLVDQAGGFVMPATPGLSQQMAQALLDFIEAQGQGEQASVVGVAVSEEAYTAEDVQHGRELFVGISRLEAGGPACLACHDAGGASAVAGGKLGPDLTLVYERLQGRRGLSAWLSSPATPTMQAVFGTSRLTEAEVQGLVAFFENTAAEGAEPSAPVFWAFLVSGLAGAAVALVVFSWAWRGRLRAVRRTLVEAVRPGGAS